ncbi:MAG TPA: AI-2E family transporter [Gaiellaceae bacterium]|nr:AI-2E family transporter [Gaiellaceae bacterium]
MSVIDRLRGRGQTETVVVTAEPIPSDELSALSSTFAAPRWLRDLGRTSWLLVGLLLVVVGLVWLLGTTYTITAPVVGATIVAAVTSPLVARLSRHMPRALATVVVLLGILAVTVAIVLLVIGGITSQHAAISEHTSEGVSKLESWAKSLGVSQSGAASAGDQLKQDVPAMISTLTKGVISGIRGLASLAFTLSLALLSVFFLLKDGPSMRGWVDHHLGVPPSVARTITGGVLRSLRGYFLGVTLVATFNGVVVGLGALILGVPLAGTIAVVTLVLAYIPFIGAFVAGAFAVIIALGANGTTTALIMLVIVILANGLLQNLVQPFAMGSALDLHPLVVLVATIASGCIFGTIGLILAAPLLSAAVHIMRDLSRAQAQSSAESESSSAAATS